MTRHETHQGASTFKAVRRRRFGQQAQVLVLGASALAGLLLWSRLKIVTDSPRTAYAVPREQAATQATPPQAVSDLAEAEQKRARDPESSEKTQAPEGP